MTTVGVISDTHGLVRPEALAALRGVDRIVHAGDICGAHVLEALRAVAPLDAIRGNNDPPGLPDLIALRIEGVRLVMIHDVKQLGGVDGAGVVVAGHSHLARNELVDGVLFFNPGSAGPRRFHLPVTVGRLVIDGTTVRGAIVRILE